MVQLIVFQQKENKDNSSIIAIFTLVQPLLFGINSVHVAVQRTEIYI